MKNLLVLALVIPIFISAEDVEYYFVCNELDNELEITPYKKELIINTKERYIKFGNVKHTGTFKNKDYIVEASHNLDMENNSSIVTFKKISGELTHYSGGMNFFKCRKANKLMP